MRGGAWYQTEIHVHVHMHDCNHFGTCPNFIEAFIQLKIHMIAQDMYKWLVKTNGFNYSRTCTNSGIYREVVLNNGWFD